ncbi:E3 ubiquitin-protein ligase TRIM35-like [Conger conger]|uniref:E3 ubiquitin-protein ligase TRIM35-like n=1 Tax=Conger conger TaxID=82655 RepID=UPI002A5AAEBA|nr:E3 ubiquitin-protein ligase TRIM35-like [Conger conger]
MASNSSVSEEDLTCRVCNDIFTDPVTLQCSHSVCKDCLHGRWADGGAGECPFCQRKTTEDPACDLDLKNLCEAILKSRIERSASGSEPLCTLHNETLKLFCLDDDEPICVVCQTSQQHENHKLRPVKEVVLKYKEEVDGALRPLQEKLESFIAEKQKSDQAADLIKSQAECTAIQIHEEFEKLRQFLLNEEVTRIAALREEEDQKSQKMKERIEKMTKEISSLTDTIRALEQDMKADDISFLQNYKATKSRAQYKVPLPEKMPGGHIDVAKHLGNLKCRVWEKMQGMVQYTTVTLDPNTKGDDLTVSEDLTSLQYRGEPDTGSLDDILKCVVLGSESFSSGKQCWDVEVGDNPAWVLGVAENSSDAGEPGEMWSIGYRDGQYEAMKCGEKTTKLTVRRDVKRVRVQLDWDRGRLSFSEPTSNTSLHTFRCRFTKRLFPLFLVASDCVPLRICPLKICVTVT